MYQLVWQWQTSGKSQRAFTSANNINYYTFRYWVKKFQEGKDTPGFIQLNARTNGRNSLCIRYPNGIEIYLPSNTPSKTLLQLIIY